jgi:uncharacterized metal-binding protein
VVEVELKLVPFIFGCRGESSAEQATMQLANMVNDISLDLLMRYSRDNCSVGSLRARLKKNMQHIEYQGE